MRRAVLTNKLKYSAAWNTLMIIAVLISVLIPHKFLTASELLPVPKGKQAQVQFWIDIFSEYRVNQSVFHDSDQPERIYMVLDFSEYPSLTGDERGRLEDEERERLGKILGDLASGKRSNLTEEEQRLLGLFGKKPDNRKLKTASGRIRIQTGMKETFKAGLERSGRYLPYIRSALKQYDIPQELAYLPHVESSFNTHARSRYGATGLWQFTYATGKAYMQISKLIDERRDPFLATSAAAELLKQHFDALQSWPLAIMAYNFGLTGMKTAVKTLKTRDPALIMNRYKHRRFGFASRNFYMEFLAAVHVAENNSRYFPDLAIEKPLYFVDVKLDTPASVSDLFTVLAVTDSVFKVLNPSLRPPIYAGTDIPAGSHIRIPVPGSGLAENVPGGRAAQESLKSALQQAWAEIGRLYGYWTWTGAPAEKKAGTGEPVEADSEIVIDDASPQLPDFWQTVRPSLSLKGSRLTVQPGETLGHYADWLQIPTQRLRKINGLAFHEKIRVGQELKLDFSEDTKKVFEEKRLAYHRKMRSYYFKQFQVADSVNHVVKSGETLWNLARHAYEIPFWLLMAWNGGMNPDRLAPGVTVRIPVVTPLSLNQQTH